jgi:hypothetical protein
MAKAEGEGKDEVYSVSFSSSHEETAILCSSVCGLTV